MDVDLIANSIKQLIIGSGKFIQEASTYEQAEERIIHLEENDDQFDKYELVKFLKSEIQQCIDTIVDKEIELHTKGSNESFSDTETLVARITDKVSKSPQFNQLKEDVSKTVIEAVDRLVENFEDEFKTVRNKDSATPTPREADQYLFSDEESNLSSSYHMFVTHEQLQKNIEHLDKKNNRQTRLAALNELIHMSLSDVLTNDDSYQKDWSYLERGIIDALSDRSDTLLPKIALKFISRGLAFSHGKTKEFYSMLCMFLLESFSTGSIPILRNGLDVKNSDVVTLLISFRLLNDFQNHVPSYWVRHSTRFLHDILNATMKLVSVGSQSYGMSTQPHLMTPLHFIALLDPAAEWFIRWTHGCYSRLPMIAAMKKHKGFLEQLVRRVLDVGSSKKSLPDLNEVTIGDFRGSHYPRNMYNEEELEYAYFIHAINIVGRVLIYKQGISLFPLKIKGYEEDVTVTKLVCALINIVLFSPVKSFSKRNSTDAYDPAVVSSEILKKLCSSEATYQECLCTNEVINTLISPVSAWIDPSTHEPDVPDDSILLNVAEILSILASRSRGRHQILYGQLSTYFGTRTSAAHCLTEFCKKALCNTLPAAHGQLSKSVTGAYLFLCRQLYNNGEGLQALYSYDLHTVISQAWIEASKSLNSLAPDSNKMDSNKIWWEETLKDNLLNFATTPNGVLLMQQSGAMQACVEYMCKRHKQRMQVSKQEKFGYGTIITQIAGTACGIIELEKQGLISHLCLDAWNSVEPSEELDVPFKPRIWPVDSIDQSAHKPLMNLLHSLSNFTSVFELIGGEKLPQKVEFTFRDKPSTLIELLNRTALINTAKDDEKIHFLFNFEESHMFGLLLLNSLVSCLDTFLLLDSQFKVLDILLASQLAEELPGSGKCIMDQLVIARNHILARCMIIGGPSERILPPISVANNTSVLQYPLITTSSIPDEYLPNLAGKSSIRQENEVGKLLSERNVTDLSSSWLDRCKLAYCSTLKSKPDSIKAESLIVMLEKAITALCGSKEEAIFTTAVPDNEHGVKTFKLTTLQELGVKKAVQYGIRLKLLPSGQGPEENLTKLLRYVGNLLKQQQRQVGSHLRSLNHNYVGFDWFVATIFLLMKGNFEKSLKFLQMYSNLAVSAYVWGARAHRSIHLPANIASSSIPPVLYSSCHNIELLLQVELPLIYNAIKMSGYTASQICQLWIRQCFWNFLDWLEIIHYICLCTLLGVDYQVYTCVAILKHLQNDILFHQQHQDLIVLLREHPISRFRLGENLEYMQQLEKKYRKTLLPGMLNLAKP